MRKLIAILLLCTSCFAQEIRRPQVDSSTGATTWAVNHCGPGSAGVASSGALAHDSAGQSTFSLINVSGSRYSATVVSRLFSSWQAESNAYSSLTLNVNASSVGYSAGAGLGAACILYSIDSGTNWTQMQCDLGPGWTQTTYTAALSSTQDLSKLRVGVCLWGESGDGVVGQWGTDSMNVYDIWTSGTIPASASTGSKTSGQPHRGLVIVH